jgi:hypothetical protein
MRPVRWTARYNGPFFRKAFHAELNRQRRDQGPAHSTNQREPTEATGKLEGLIEAITDGLRTPALLARLEDVNRHGPITPFDSLRTR